MQNEHLSLLFKLLGIGVCVIAIYAAISFILTPFRLPGVSYELDQALSFGALFIPALVFFCISVFFLKRHFNSPDQTQQNQPIIQQNETRSIANQPSVENSQPLDAGQDGDTPVES